MKIIKFSPLLLCLLSLSWAELSIAAPLTLERLRQIYGDIKGIEAQALQTKTSPLLLRPLVTKVDIQLKGKQLEWRVQGQKTLRVDFSQENAPRFLSDGDLPLEIPEASRLKLMRTLEAIRDLMTMDSRLEKRFQLSLDGQTLQLKPLRDEVFFQNIRIDFDAAEKIEKLTFLSADEETQLQFLKLSIER